MVFKRGGIAVGGVKGVYSVLYSGPGISTNAFYAGAFGKKGWKSRTGIKNKYSKIFIDLIQESKVPWMDEYMVVLFYNSKQDPDNTIGGSCKLFLDSLKQDREQGLVTRKGWVYDDSKTYCKGVMSIPDTTLPHNTFEFILLHLK